MSRAMLYVATGALIVLLVCRPALAGPYEDCFKLKDDAGIGACSFAIQLALRDSDLYQNRGTLYYEKGDLDRAFADYSKAIELNPRHADAHYGLGKVQQDKGDHDQAIASYSKVIELQPAKDDASNGRCWSRAAGNRDLPLGLADCDAAIRLKSTDADNNDSRGFMFMMLNRLDDAIADYNSALRINPRLAESLCGRGIAKRRKGDEAGAQADLALAASVKPGVAEEYSRYGLK